MAKPDPSDVGLAQLQRAQLNSIAFEKSLSPEQGGLITVSIRRVA